MAKRKSEEPAAQTESARSPEYTVLARRYRPQQFSDLVGQEPITQVLMNAITGQRVAHAYLFTGARGVGKTSAARILAKALNCVKGPTITPCDECDMCKAITSGEDMDVLEIDGASNNGVEQVRELRQNVNFRPSRSRYKIYIIDEVHMLSTAAFNALLKTLEEPPPHVKFIFATTEVQKIPVTILSRCQRFDFAGIGIPRIVERLKQIVASEKMLADDEALQLIARRAGGSMRDAQSLLDQLLSFGSEKLTAAQVNQLLGTANEERIAALAGAVLDKNAARALELLGETVDLGLQLGELLDQLIEYWRDLMIVQCTKDDSQALSVTGANRQALKQQAGRLQLDTILAGLDILATARTRLRGTSQGRVLLEMALVRLSRLEELVSLSQLAQWAAREAPPASAPRVAGPAALPVPPDSGGARSPGVATSATPEPAEKKKELTDSVSPSPPSPISLSPETLQALWSQISSESGLAISTELRRGEVAISGPNALVLRFPSGYNHTLDTQRQDRLAASIRKVIGPSVTLRIENGSVSPASSAPTSAGAQPSEQATQATEPETAGTRLKRQRGELNQLPLVKKALDVLGAQVIHLDEDFATASAPPPAEETSNDTGDQEQE